MVITAKVRPGWHGASPKLGLHTRLDSMVMDSSLKSELLSSLNKFTKFEFCKRSKTVKLGQNLMLTRQPRHLCSIQSLAGFTSPDVNARSVGSLGKNSNIATFGDILI